MTVFEYIIDTLPRKFTHHVDSENKNVLFLYFKDSNVNIESKEGYFVVMYEFINEKNKLKTIKFYYTQTSNKHELLGLLVELTK